MSDPLHAPAPAPVPLQEIVDNFAFLDEWEDRYRYLIELGRTLQPMGEGAHSEVNKVRGCASQVWLETSVAPGPVLSFRGDSDAHIVRGLVALMLAACSGRSATDIAALDLAALFDGMGLAQHLTPQRSNGVRAMAERIRADARAALQAAPMAGR